MLARLLGALRARLRVIERRWISDATERAAHQEVVVRRLAAEATDRSTAPAADDAAR
jgi:hypothetical protein